MKKHHLYRQNFTLIEVVVAIVIVVTMASVAAPIYLNYIKSANVKAAKTQIKELENALTGYRLDVGSYPDGEDGLEALVENLQDEEKWNGPYIRPRVPKDPWGNDYIYRLDEDGRSFEVISLGADGEEGGEGEDADISSRD